MTSRSPSRVRPLSSTALPAPQPEESSLKRKYSLDHGEKADGWKQSTNIDTQSKDEYTEVDRRPEMTPGKTENTSSAEEERFSNLVNGNGGKDINHNGPSEMVIKDCKRKVLKKQTSFESIGCDDNYFYDFFDRNCRPPTPTQTTSEEPIPPAVPSNSEETIKDIENHENNNSQVETTRLENNSGASSKLRRNLNDGRVRPRSWLTTTSTGKVEDPRRVRRRQTDPCGKDFLSNYERALSSLLYQPYECRTESPSVSTNLDDSDVGYWLGPNPKRWRERERRSVGECCSYQNESTDSSSRSSLSSSSSSMGDYMRRKPWGDCKDPSSSSIRALLSEWRTGNVAESSDLDAGLARDPPGALATGWSPASHSQSSAGHGREMLVSATEPETRGSQSDLLGSAARSASEDPVSVSCYRAVPATVSAVPVIPCNNVSNVRIVQTTRTFTSTEAQTDDVIVDAIRAPPGPSREQRRRERRERRHQRRLLHPHQTPDPAVWHTPMTEPMVDRLPDILNSHLPPPYSTLPVGVAPPPPQGHLHPPPPLPPPMAVTTVPGSPPPQPAALRFPFAIVPTGRRR